MNGETCHGEEKRLGVKELLSSHAMTNKDNKDNKDDTETAEAYAPCGAVLVTGGAGFIGSHFVNLLTLERPDIRVVVLDRMDYTASDKNLLYRRSCDETDGAIRCDGHDDNGDDASSFTSPRLVVGDVQDVHRTTQLLREEGVDTVVHFAAQTHVDNSFGNSLAFTLSNTFGTHALLEACKTYGNIRRFVFVSTDEVYGETSVESVTGLLENSHLDPTNPYSAAKAGAEMMCRAYATSFGVPIIVTRGNNVYGPKQFPEKLVPKFILLASLGRALPIHGDGKHRRSYLYVDDVARAFATILFMGATGEVYNIGTACERTVLSVANDIRRAVARAKTRKSMDATQNNNNDEDQTTTATTHFVRDRAFNDRRYFIGSAKLERLGWKQSVAWEDGLARTVAWYMNKDCQKHWNVDSRAIEVALRPHPPEEDSA